MNEENMTSSDIIGMDEALDSYMSSHVESVSAETANHDLSFDMSEANLSGLSDDNLASIPNYAETNRASDVELIEMVTESVVFNGKTGFNNSELIETFEENFESSLPINGDGQLENETEYKCYICNKCFSDETSLNHHHKLIHETGAKFKCIECDVTFESEESRTFHMKNHKTERLYKCALCRLQFPSCDRIVHHVQTGHILHTDASGRYMRFVFECATCSKRYQTSDSLSSHIQQIHSKVTESNDAESTLKVLVYSESNGSDMNQACWDEQPFVENGEEIVSNDLGQSLTTMLNQNGDQSNFYSHELLSPTTSRLLSLPITPNRSSTDDHTDEILDAIVDISQNALHSSPADPFSQALSSTVSRLESQIRTPPILPSGKSPGTDPNNQLSFLETLETVAKLNASNTGEPKTPLSDNAMRKSVRKRRQSSKVSRKLLDDKRKSGKTKGKPVKHKGKSKKENKKVKISRLEETMKCRRTDFPFSKAARLQKIKAERKKLRDEKRSESMQCRRTHYPHIWKNKKDFMSEDILPSEFIEHSYCKPDPSVVAKKSQDYICSLISVEHDYCMLVKPEPIKKLEVLPKKRTIKRPKKIYQDYVVVMEPDTLQKTEVLPEKRTIRKPKRLYLDEDFEESKPPKLVKKIDSNNKKSHSARLLSKAKSTQLQQKAKTTQVQQMVKTTQLQKIGKFPQVQQMVKTTQLQQIGKFPHKTKLSKPADSKQTVDKRPILIGPKNRSISVTRKRIRHNHEIAQKMKTAKAVKALKTIKPCPLSKKKKLLEKLGLEMPVEDTTPVNLYKCEICHKKFAMSRTVLPHLQRHMDARPDKVVAYKQCELTRGNIKLFFNPKDGSGYDINGKPTYCRPTSKLPVVNVAHVKQFFSEHKAS